MKIWLYILNKSVWGLLNAIGMIDIFDNVLINFEAVIENLVKNIDIFDNFLINFEAVML